MATGYSEDQVRLANALAQLQHIDKIAEAWGDFYSLADFTDSTTFNREDGVPGTGFKFGYGMAFSQALQRPSATACAYYTEQQLRLLRAASRAFCMLNPYWMAVRENRINYAIGTGHVYSIVPRHKGQKVPDELTWKVTDEIDLFCKLNHYRRLQGEKLTRLDRDGEYFLRYYDHQDDGVLRVRFMEPLLLQDPPGTGPEGDVIFGIGFKKGNYVDPIRYYFKEADYLGNVSNDIMGAWRRGIPADQIQRQTVNVDLNSPRGLPSTYTLQDVLTQALSTLRSMGKLVDVRARIAAIRKSVNATQGQIQSMLLRGRSGGPPPIRNVNQFGYGSIVDLNDQRSIEFPAQNIETDKIVSSLKADLQSVAAATGLADFTISGDSHSAFSNALVKEGPMDRAVGKIQADLIENDIEVYERALTVAIAEGRLDKDTLKRIRIDILPPGVIARDRLPNTQADEILVRNGAMSPDTMSMRANLDPGDEREKIKANPPLASTANGDTRSNQAPIGGQASGRGVPAGSEPGPAANRQHAAQEGIEESSSDDRGQQKPTGEDMRVASKVITPEWLETTKRELLSLPDTGHAIRDNAVGEYEPGIPGIYLGVVDGQEVWGVDFDCLVVRYDAPDICVGANSERWTFVPKNKILIDWANRITDVLHIALHELIEQRAMALIGWTYSRSHRLANNMPGGEMDFLLTIRPELKALLPPKESE